MGHSAIYPSDVWETDVAPVINLRPNPRTVLRPPIREMAVRSVVAKAQANATKVACSIISKDKKTPERKMGGLSLPDVVRELLKERNILRWNADEGVYEVIHGENFETRFNELRKVRNKSKPSGVERPFSRMYNFFVLESGDKWARTGTKFRPRNSKGLPSPGALVRSSREVRRGHTPAHEQIRAERAEAINAALSIEAVAAPKTPEQSSDENNSDEEESSAPAETITEQTHGETCGGSEESEPCSPAAEEFFLPEAEEAEAEECVAFEGFVREASPAPVPAETSYYSSSSDFAHPMLNAAPSQEGEPPVLEEEPAVAFTSEMDVDSILRPEELPLSEETSIADCENRRCVSATDVCDPSKFYCLHVRGVVDCEEDCDARSVCDVSSPDASCQSSPEGALSICGEFGGSPLDIGAPALDHSTAVATAAAMMMVDGCDGMLITSLDAPLCW